MGIGNFDKPEFNSKYQSVDGAKFERNCLYKLTLQYYMSSIIADPSESYLSYQDVSVP